MPPPIPSLRFSDPVTVNLFLLDPSFADQVNAARELFLSLSLPGEGTKIWCDGVFETSMISISCEATGMQWKLDFQLVWPKPMMDANPGELRLVNWFAIGNSDQPAGADFARQSAWKALVERINFLCQPGQAMAGRIRILNA